MSEQRVSAHKAVFITYRILDDQENICEQNDIPVGYVHGANSNLFEQIEKTLEGHVVGDEVEVILKPEEAFGYPDPQYVIEDDIDNVPPEFRFVGAEASMANQDEDSNEMLTVVVSKIEDGKVKMLVTSIDDGEQSHSACHPLAGKTIKFIVNITEIREATPAEISNGVPDGGFRLH